MTAFDAIRFQKRRNTHRFHAILPLHLTEIDQAFVVWGALTVVVFSFGQFSPMAWAAQAVMDAALTGIGIVVTSGLTWAIATQAKLRWVVLLWAALMSAGTIATAYGIFYGSALIVSHLCLLWLGLCAAGYGVMAVGMRSRCFTAAFWVHGGAMIGLGCALGDLLKWQFFYSGLVIASTLFFFSVVPWDREAR